MTPLAEIPFLHGQLPALIFKQTAPFCLVHRRQSCKQEQHCAHSLPAERKEKTVAFSMN